MMQTAQFSTDAQGFDAASAVLRAGGLIAFPTETVYGLGGDAHSDMAVARIFEAKGRPRFNPLIVHVATLDQARELAEFDSRALALAQRFWPGPLTLVLPARAGNGISELVSADLPSLAIRIPAHTAARALLAAFGGPLAAPSANPSGRISPTTAAHVMQGLGGRIAGVLDGGPCAVGVESTILSLLGDAPHILRHGGCAAEDIEAALGAPLAPAAAPDAQRPVAPGQLVSHYAPAAALRLNAVQAHFGEVLIGFGAVAGDISLSPQGDLVQAAAHLFAALRKADDMAGAGGAIAVAPIPDHGLGRAINDRLARAAAPRT
jgi:L-threonylcarbamoyladenylate synthase